MVRLQGMVNEESQTLLPQFCCASEESELPNLAELSQDLQQLIHQFARLFSAPTGLPPHRACNHVIPLLPGANPIIIRPYRYSPKLKDELEKQVTTMLQQGIIQPSASMFSSPVLLVHVLFTCAISTQERWWI